MDVTFHTKGVSFKACEIKCNSVILGMEFQARQDHSNQSMSVLTKIQIFTSYLFHIKHHIQLTQHTFLLKTH